MSEKKKTPLVLEGIPTLQTADAMLAHYAGWAADYDHDLLVNFGYIAHQVSVKALDNLLDNKQARIIDAGCGTGLVGAALTALGYSQIDGLDFSPEMLAKAEQRGVYKNLFQGDLNKQTPLAAGGYDAVICVGAFGGVHVGPDGYDELVRVAKPGAPMVIHMNEIYYKAHGYPAKFAELEREGLWQIKSIVKQDLMTKVDRPGRLIIAKRN